MYGAKEFCRVDTGIGPSSRNERESGNESEVVISSIIKRVTARQTRIDRSWWILWKLLHFVQKRIGRLPPSPRFMIGCEMRT